MGEISAATVPITKVRSSTSNTSPLTESSILKVPVGESVAEEAGA